MAGTAQVIVGVIVKGHGVRGDLVVESHSDEPSRFAPGAVLRMGTRSMVVASSRALNAQRLVVHFEGVETRNDAEALVGEELRAEVSDDERPADADEFFDRHLVGLTACLPDDTPVGQVIDVLHGAAQDILVIKTDDAERLVPFVEALVPSVNLDEGRLTIADLPGLLSDVEE
ncbi:MAG: ribosome maturation factor RimM [Propionibacteriaceae bacterium]|nr:ribosome maturation factor RimM [Propionibacteriaceae bacterium]